MRTLHGSLILSACVYAWSHV